MAISTAKASLARKKEKHPLTEQFIALVGGGMEPYDAVMSLIGPALPLVDANNQLFEWEIDPEVTTRIDWMRQERIKSVSRAKQGMAETLISIVTQDVRRYFRQKADSDPRAPQYEPVPVPQWTRQMAMAVKKIKFTSRTDPFGNVTDQVNLEFHDPLAALKTIKDLMPEALEEQVDVTAITPEDVQTMQDEELSRLRKLLVNRV